MLKLYYGRENVNKENFLIDRIKDDPKDVILIAPDQFTMEMENLILRGLGQKAIFGIEVLHFNRLGDKILNEVGGSRKAVIDKYGRHMLLTKIAISEKDNLDVYKGQESKVQFIDMVNNFISELKRAGVGPTELNEYIRSLDNNSYTAKKLSVINRIYEKYEEVLGNEYFDIEKKVDEYTNKIEESNYLNGKTIWIYGFDSLAPKEIRIITELLKKCDVNIILTYDEDSDDDIFELSKLVIDNLEKIHIAEVKKEKIPVSYEIKKEKGIDKLEKNLFKFESDNGLPSEGVRVIEASNISNEAENVSMIVLDLIKNEGLKMSDIRIICNDIEERVPMLKRMFTEYGLTLFSDEKVSIIDTNIVQYILAGLESIKSYSTSLIIKMLKTGFSNLEDDEILDLENYTYKYKIKGNMWKKDFFLFDKDDKDCLPRINTLRKKVVDSLLELEEISKEKNVEAFIDRYLDYLEKDLEDDSDNKIDKVIKLQEELGRNDLADLTNQAYSEVKNILNQIKEILNNVNFNLKDFIDIFRVGLSSIEVGLVPPVVDGIVLGTALRSRFAPKKAVIVYGANEGILPEGKYDAVILSNEERKLFNKYYKEKENSNKEDKEYVLKGVEIKSKEIARLEENMGIYRNLSRATDNLIFTYSLGNISGEKVNPAEVIKKVLQILDINKEKDLVEGNSPLLLNNECAGKRHLIEKLKEKNDISSTDVDTEWEKYLAYLKEEEKDFVNTIVKEMQDKNVAKAIGEDKARDLYFNDSYTVSPSKIESYTRCPFRYFIDYGIKPKEKRVFEVDRRISGDIYHKIFEKLLSSSIDKDNKFNSGKVPSKKEDVIEFVIDFVNSDEFRKEFPQIENMEAFEYLKDRIIATAVESAWTLVKHIKKGEINELHCEEEFKGGDGLNPIKFTLSNGKEGFIAGKIDRYDILSDGETIKIIDYKTGQDTLEKAELEAGYRLQLYIYYKAVKDGLEKKDNKEYKLGGLFYYHIWEPKLDDKDKSEEDLEDEISKTYKMKGLFIENVARLNLIDNATNESPQVCDYKLTNKGEIDSRIYGHIYTEEEFAEVESKVNDILLNNFNSLVSGKIDIHPMKSLKGSHCDYCNYKNICRFDERMFINEYNRDVIKRKKELKKDDED